MKYILLLVLAFLCGCSTKVPNNPLDHFDDVVEMKAMRIVDLGEYDILSPRNIVKHDNWFFFRELGDEMAAVKGLSDDLSKNIKGLRQGNGPFEVVGRTVLCVIDDTVRVIDSNHRRIFSILVDGDSLKVLLAKENCLVNTTSIALEMNRFIQTSRRDSMMYSLVDAETNVVSKVMYPQNVSLNEYNWLAQNSIYMNTVFACSPDKQHYAWGVMYYALFGFGEILDLDSLTLNTVYEYFPMKVQEVVEYEDGRMRIQMAHDNITSTISCVGTDKYALFLYSGRLVDNNGKLDDWYADDILIYKWDGTPFRRLKTDTRMADIQYDAKRNVLFGIAYMPEATLVEYDMSAMSK